MQSNLVAGDTLNFPVTATGYSAADGWALKFRLVPRIAPGTVVDITATADGVDFRVSVAASVTATWAAGDYGWWSWVEKGAEKYSLQSGQITVQPDPRQTAAGLDTRGTAQRVLDALQAAYRSHVESGSAFVGEYSVAGRSVKYRSLLELQQAIARAKRDVQAEAAADRIAQGQSPRRTFFVRM